MKIFKKISKILLIVLISALFVNSNVQSKQVEAASTYEEQLQEYRAVWVSHFVGDIAKYKNETQYKAAVDELLNQVSEWNMNAIVFHVRTHNNALYNSKLNPLAHWWDGVDFDVFDPLKYIIEECHARGIEFHAWMNPYRITTTGTYPMNSSATSYPEGNPANDPSNFIQVGNNIILDPGIPTNRDFIVETCMELVENYDIDAIHFDDYFYISGADDTETRKKYNTEGLSLGDFRRKQVDLFIEQLHNEISAYNEANNKAIEIGISPSGVYRNGSYSSSTKPQYDSNGNLTYPLYSNTGGFAHYDNYLYSDTKYWIDQEWIDYITPQTYHGINNQYSPFGKLVEWWNWVVEHKKVNLSFGIGIYMAVDNSGSWTTPNEFENQMLIANQGKNTAGLCLYKYGSLFDGSTNMKSHVNAMKSNWTKKIPSAVKPQHTNLPEVAVRNIKLNGNVITWDKLDNVRGYMVWQVKKGNIVDTTNLDHLYDYVQENTITVEDGYDYYVSSVNLANEISDPVYASSASEPEQLVNAINNIVFPVLIENETYYNSLKSRYDALSNEDKAIVTNYNLLVAALEQLATIKSMEGDSIKFQESLNSDVLDKYLLPLTYDGYSISWDYMDNADKTLYNIETGEVLVEYLATTLVELKYTMSKNGVSYSSTFNLNVGYVKQNETGLIYRNTPNALNKDEDPTANVNFIGWAGVALKFTLNNINYVFYPAEGNYHELTSSEIPTSKWHSCGYLYKNVSNNNITATGQALVVNENEGYGYFIVGSNGLVNYCVSSASKQDSITLKPGEMLFIPNYLNSQMKDPILKSGANFPVGTKVELVTVKWTDEENDETLAQEIIEQIELIGNVTLDSESQIERAENLYNNATPSVKALVTNYNELVAARNTLNQLKEESKELNKAKEQAINIISGYLPNMNDYSEVNQKTINALISSFTSLVQNKTSKQEIDFLVDEYKVKLDAIKTMVEEEAEIIVLIREKAIEDLNKVITDKTLYSAENVTKINNIITQYTTSINNANKSIDVESLLAEATDKLKAVPTKLETAKVNALEEVEGYYNSINLSEYSNSSSSSIRSYVATAKIDIQSAKSIEEINSIISKMKENIDNLPKLQSSVDLTNAKKNAIENIENYIDLSSLSSQEKEEIQAIITEYTNKINNATSEANINSLVQEAYNLLDEFESDPFNEIRKAAYNEAVEYVESKGLKVGNSQVASLLEQLENDLSKANTSTKIDQLVDDFKTKCDKLVPKKDNSVSCLGAAYISSIILMFSLTFVLISKKRH